MPDAGSNAGNSMAAGNGTGNAVADFVWILSPGLPAGPALSAKR